MTFDSWYGYQPLAETLEQIGFHQILIHAKGNYVFTIDDYQMTDGVLRMVADEMVGISPAVLLEKLNHVLTPALKSR